MPQRLYIETTIVSYVAAQRSADLILAGRQELTRQWWMHERQHYDLCISELVEREAARGDAIAAAKRLDLLNACLRVPITSEARSLAGELILCGLLPSSADADAMHLSCAVVNKLDMFLTWNCRHLANPRILGAIGRFVRRIGYELPIVCTPNELMGAEDGSGE